MLSSVGLGIFTVSDGHFGKKISKRQTTFNRFSLSQNVEATWRLAPTSRTCNFKKERAVKMKLASLVVLLVVYGKWQTDLECAFSTPRYS